MAKSDYPVLSSVVIRRSAINSKGTFDENLGNKGEKEFLLRLIHGKRVAEVPRVFVTTEIDRENPFEDIENRIDELLRICTEFDLGKNNTEVYVSIVREMLSVIEGYCGTDRKDLALKIYDNVKADEVFQEADLGLIRETLRIQDI